MSHPFQVGKTYRNRVGEYVVESLEGNDMAIRYVGGGPLETSVHLQTRIWENIQFEEQMAREEERRRLAHEERLEARRLAKIEKARPRFGGFQESDFEVRKRGIAWAKRKDLGRVLAYELNQQRTGAGFDNWVIPRQSGVTVARKEQFDKEHRGRNAAFFVAASEEGASYGLLVGRSAGDQEATWPWSVFVSRLADDNDDRRALRKTMRIQDLSLDVYAMQVRYGQVGRITVQPRGFLWQQETADQEVTQKMDWKKMEELLRTLAPGKRCELHLSKHLPMGPSLEAGAGIAQEVLTLIDELMPLYDTLVGI
ncbi:hypothetical protein ACFLTC_00820 [Chloroflexota bacterium]